MGHLSDMKVRPALEGRCCIQLGALQNSDNKAR